MSEFVHERHKPPVELDRPRELVVICAPLRSRVNLSRIARTVSCCGVRTLVACGNARLDPTIARDAVQEIEFIQRRSLLPVLHAHRDAGFELVGLEQTTNSRNLHEFAFQRKTALVIGNERLGLESEALAVLDHVVEIPVYGKPFSYNVATATSMALYEYCRQFPRG